MLRNNYKGKNIEYYSMTCLRGYKDCQIIGDNIFITSMNGAPYAHHTGMDPENCIWIMNLGDGFQNIANFCKGIEYIDKYATPTIRQKCFDVLMSLELKSPKLDIEEKSKRIAFFCEVGVWKDSKNRNKDLYHKDFKKYLWNCRWNYRLLEESGMIVMPSGVKVAFGTSDHMNKYNYGQKYAKFSEAVLGLTSWNEKILCNLFDNMCAPDFCCSDVTYVMNRLNYDALEHLKKTMPKDFQEKLWLNEAMTLAKSGRELMNEIESLNKENK